MTLRDPPIYDEEYVCKMVNQHKTSRLLPPIRLDYINNLGTEALAVLIEKLVREFKHLLTGREKKQF